MAAMVYTRMRPHMHACLCENNLEQLQQVVCIVGGARHACTLAPLRGKPKSVGRWLLRLFAMKTVATERTCSSQECVLRPVRGKLDLPSTGSARVPEQILNGHAIDGAQPVPHLRHEPKSVRRRCEAVCHENIRHSIHLQ